MTRCVIYSRVSTDAQERDGTSLDTQERACREYANKRGWQIVEELRDAASGFTLERSGLTRARDLAKAGLIDVLLCYALDRISRKQTHVAILVEEMEDYGACLDFVTEKFEDTATGQLLRSVKAFAAEFEREKIAERTMRGKAERARSGRMPQATGRGTYGYAYDPTSGQRQIVAHQACVVRRLFEGFAAGLSITGLANSLNEEGVPTMQGKLWSAATIFHLLHNEAYAGRTTYRRLQAVKVRDPESGKKHRKLIIRPDSEWIDVPGATPALISATLFDSVQARLSDPERLRMGRRKSTYGLAGHIKCRRCGASMVGQTLRGKFRYYRCRRAFAGPKHDRCESRYIRADHLESSLLAEIAEALSRPEVVRAELMHLVPGDGRREEMEAARTRLESLERQRVRLLKLYQLGEIDDEYLHRESRTVQTEVGRLKRTLERDDPQTRDLPRQEDLEAICGRVAAWVSQRGVEHLPLIAQALQIVVMAGNDGSEVAGFLPEYASDCDHADVCSVVSC